MRNLSALVAALLVLSLAAQLTFSQNAIGTSTVSVSNANVTVSRGSSASDTYTVSLASGSTWGTSLNVVNVGALAQMGITVSLTNSYAEPPYSGTATISVSNTTEPGNYTVQLDASGDDPSRNITTIGVMVPSSAPSGPAANSTSAPTTVAVHHNSTVSLPGTPSRAPNYGAYDAAAVIIVAVAIIVAFLAFRKK